MADLTIGILQGNFRSCFDEKYAHVAAVADRVAEMGEAEFRHNFELLKRLARREAEQGAQLVLGPESFLDGWSAKWDVIRRVATPVPGPVTRELCALARELSLWLCTASSNSPTAGGSSTPPC